MYGYSIGASRKRQNKIVIKIIMFFLPFFILIICAYMAIMFIVLILAANNVSSVSSNSGTGYTYDEIESILGLPFSIRDETFKISSLYGMRMHPILQEMKFHEGIDFDIEEGTPILAAESGIVEQVGFDSDGYGNYVRIGHTGNIKTMYGHMKEFVVTNGEPIIRGQVIGYCGSTGRSTGSHLHFEVLEGESSVDPMVAYLVLRPNIQDGLSPELKFTDINVDRLKEYLISKESMLAEDRYIVAIISACRMYNVNPLLLFAITGQEQSFVRRTDVDAEKIANNPFNVWHSWEEYNTSIEDSANIAANTVVVLSQGCPEEVDPIEWINKGYAEDENWHTGVRFFFDQLKQYCE